MGKRPKRLACMRCGQEFDLHNLVAKVVSCPSCGSMLDVRASQIQRANPAFQVSKPSPKAVVLTPRAHTGEFRCLSCAKTFLWEKDFTDPKERYTKPYCPFCDSPDVLALTPLAAVRTQGDAPGGKKAKLARFVRRNFKALCELRSHFKSSFDILGRTTLSPPLRGKMEVKLRAIYEEILGAVEMDANQRLDERMKAMGIADGDDIL